MKAGWTLKKLRDVCELINGRAYGKSELLAEGKYRVLRVGNFFTNNHWYYSDLELEDKKYCDNGDLLYAWSASFGPRIWIGEKVIYHYHIWKVLPHPNLIDQRYLFHFFNWDTESIKEDQGAGTTMLHVSKGSMEDRNIPVPSLPEQRRIVALLDEAFDDIATAQAHTEKNLQNARSIFESHQQSVFTQRGDGWTVKPLGEFCERVEYGTSAKSKDQGKVPVLRMGNIQNGKFDWEKLVFTDDDAEIEKYQLKNDDVLFNRTNSPELVGKTAIFKNERPAIFAGYLIRIHRKTELLDADYLTYFLNSKIAMDYGKTVTTSSVNQANINGAKLKTYPIPVPSLKVQQAEVQVMHALREKTQHLESLYQRKIAALDALKKSLLHRAFSGQLTSATQTGVSQQSALQTTTPEFTANVISFAYAQHERKKREKTFGHVKEQKVLHLVESIAGIDLGRHPMRNAAGPNDFAHMLKAEEWAKAHGFFEVAKRDGGYEFKKLSAFDEHMSRARQALEPYLPRLESVIDLLVPMDTAEAEVFATVHAAWNNLLIDGMEVTDDAIVSAAREDWHADKLKIPEHKFRTAIALIRQKNLVPDGTAKYVGDQHRLI